MQKRLNGNNVRLQFADRVADFHVTVLLDPKALLGQNTFCLPSPMYLKIIQVFTSFIFNFLVRSWLFSNYVSLHLTSL